MPSAPERLEIDVDGLREASPRERVTMLRSWLTRTVAAGLRCRPGELDPGRPLNAIGLDSLVGMELRTSIERGLGVSLPMVILLDGPSVSSLTDLLLRELDARESADAGPLASPLP
jgi:aryl carrier-like protein